jgi:hypothetical protein
VQTINANEIFGEMCMFPDICKYRTETGKLPLQASLHAPGNPIRFLN